MRADPVLNMTPQTPSTAAHKKRGGSHGLKRIPRLIRLSPSKYSLNWPGTVLFFLGSSV